LDAVESPLLAQGVAAPKAQTGWWLKFDRQNLSIENNHPALRATPPGQEGR